MKIHSKKRTLLTSIVSLILCITVLLGTTFAWFTATSKSTGNRILTGGMGVKLYKYDATEQKYLDISEGSGDIFTDEGKDGVLWKPGHTEIVFLQVENSKSLALVYNLILDVSLFMGADGREDMELTDAAEAEEALAYAVMPGMTAEAFDAEQYKDWEDICNASGVITDVLTAAGKTTALEGRELKEKGVCDFFALAVHMNEQADDKYQGSEIFVDVDILAKQMAYEQDSFSNQYDANATFVEKYYDVLKGLGNMEPVNNSGWSLRDKAANTHGKFEFVKDAGAQDDSYYVKMTNSIDACHFGSDCTCETHTPVFTAEKQSVQIQRGDLANYLTAGQEYILKFWIKQSDIEYPADVRLLIGTTVTTKTAIAAALEEAGNDTWCEVSYKFTMPADYTTETYTRLILLTDQTAPVDSTVCVDNIRICAEEVPQTVTGANAFKAMLAAENKVSMLPARYSSADIWKPALEGTPENYLTNGSFDTSIDNWVGNKNTPTTMYSWVEDDSTSDGGYFKIANKENKKAPAVGQVVEGIRSGAEYQLSFDYKIDPKNSVTTPFVDIECFHEADTEMNTNHLGGIELKFDSTKFIADGQWHTYSYRFRTLEMTEWVEVWLRHTGNKSFATAEGAVCYDNVVLTMTDIPDDLALSLNPMKIFYTDMEETEFVVTLDESQSAEYENAEIVFEVYDGQDRVFESAGIPLQNGSASTTFALERMEKLGSPYVLLVSLYAGEELKCQIGQNIFIYDRPAALDEDGNYVKFGDDFVPVMGYHVSNIMDSAGERGHMEYLPEAGVTVVQTTNGYAKEPQNLLKLLDELHELGLKALVSLYIDMNPAGHESNMETTIGIVSNPEIRNHPALFGYNIADEPYYQNPDADAVRRDLENSYRLIRQYDKDNIITFVENYEEKYAVSSTYSDGLLIDVYEPASGAVVYSNIAYAREAAMKDRPIWSILSTFPDRNGNFNTPDDVRNNNYQAFLAGAVGIGYFAISDTGNFYVDKLPNEIHPAWAEHVQNKADGYIPLWEATTPYPWGETHGKAVWNALKSFTEKETAILCDHFIDNEGKMLSKDINIEAGYMYYSWAAENGKIYLAVLDVKGDTFDDIIRTNVTEYSDVTVNIPLKDADGNAMTNYTATIVAGRENFGPVTGNDGTLTITLVTDFNETGITGGVETLLFEITEN